MILVERINSSWIDCPESCGSSVCKMTFSFGLRFDVDVNVTYAVPPPVPVRATDAVHQKSGISLYLPVLGFAVAGAFFLLISLWFLCCHCLKIEQARLRLYGIIDRMEVGEIFINGEQPVQPVEDHPIWYIRTQGLQQSVIDSISVAKFEKNEGLVEGSDCSICLSEFEEDESLPLLPNCAHAFHVPCIDQWFMSHKNCPLCRSPVTNVTTAAAPVEEVGLEGQQSDELMIEDVNNTSSFQDDSDSSVSQNGRNGLLADEELSFSGTSKSKPESDLTKRHRVDNDEVLPPIRRSVSSGPATSSNIYNATADIRIHVHSNTSTESGCSPVQRIKATGASSSMKRSASYGGKPSSLKSGRSQKSILPY